MSAKLTRIACKVSRAFVLKKRKKVDRENKPMLDKVAPRQAPEQPREHGKRAEMGREPGAVNKKSGPSEPLSRLRKNKKARQVARHKRFRFAKTLVHKQFICLCAVKCPTDTKTGAFAPCKHFAQQNLGGGGIHFHRAF